MRLEEEIQKGMIVRLEPLRPDIAQFEHPILLIRFCEAFGLDYLCIVEIFFPSVIFWFA